MIDRPAERLKMANIALKDCDPARFEPRCIFTGQGERANSIAAGLKRGDQRAPE